MLGEPSNKETGKIRKKSEFLLGKIWDAHGLKCASIYPFQKASLYNTFVLHNYFHMAEQPHVLGRRPVDILVDHVDIRLYSTHTSAPMTLIEAIMSRTVMIHKKTNTPIARSSSSVLTCKEGFCSSQGQNRFVIFICFELGEGSLFKGGKCSVHSFFAL